MRGEKNPNWNTNEQMNLTVFEMSNKHMKGAPREKELTLGNS